jgi:hypothetical protein
MVLDLRRSDPFDAARPRQIEASPDDKTLIRANDKRRGLTNEQVLIYFQHRTRTAQFKLRGLEDPKVRTTSPTRSGTVPCSSSHAMGYLGGRGRAPVKAVGHFGQNGNCWLCPHQILVSFRPITSTSYIWQRRNTTLMSPLWRNSKAGKRVLSCTLLASPSGTSAKLSISSSSSLGSMRERNQPRSKDIASP